MLKISELVGEKIEIDGAIFEVEGTEAVLDSVFLKVKRAEIEKKKYVLSEQSLLMMNRVHPNLVKVMKEAIVDSPYDFRITAGARTAQEQNALYQLGRTRAGNIVTKADGYKNKSNHQIKNDGFGYAVDIFVCGEYDKNGNYVKFTTEQGYDNKKMKVVADHIKATAKKLGLNIEWGGDWKFYDSPHFELKG